MGLGGGAMGWKVSAWFGGGGKGSNVSLAESVEYKGYSIQPAPKQESGQWRTAGVISRSFDNDEIKEHHFIRAAIHGNLADVDDFSIIKGRQIIDDFGDRMFEDK